MRRKTKKLISFILSILFIILFSLTTIYYKEDIYIFIRDNIFKEKETIKLEKNKYFKDKDYLFVQNTNDFVAKDKKHLINIIYTILNSGTESFKFYCDESYEACIFDIEELADNATMLSNINNFVHPYNSFKKIFINYNNFGEVTITVKKTYTQKQIQEIDKKLDEIIKEQIKDNMNDKQKIRAIHDYIINNTKYATEDAKNNDQSYNTAYELLFNNLSLCSGYADTTQILLDKLEIESYKIASDTHIWNLVYIDNSWLHLDTTWDDPVTENNEDKLEVIFFLITDKRLNELRVDEHNYDADVYKEAKS